MADYNLVMRAGPNPGMTFQLTGNEISIGRDINADFVISIPEVSRRHALIRPEAGGYILEDLGSTNGTFVNGRRLSGPYNLRAGDTVMLGEAVTLFAEGPQFDPDATVVSAVSPVATEIAQEPVSPPVQPQQPAQPQPPAQPASPSGHAATMLAHDPIAAPQQGDQGPPPVQVAQQPPSFAGQVPAGPMEFGESYPAEEPPQKRTWLWGGMGCLAVMLCGCVAGAIIFDMMNMYCQPPFDSLLSFLYTCP